MLFHFLLFLTPHLHSSLYFPPTPSPRLTVLKTSSPAPQVQRIRSYISILAYHLRGHWELWWPSDIIDGQHGQAPRERLGLIPIASQVTSLGLDLFSLFLKFSLKNIYLSLLCMKVVSSSVRKKLDLKNLPQQNQWAHRVHEQLLLPSFIAGQHIWEYEFHSQGHNKI